MSVSITSISQTAVDTITLVADVAYNNAPIDVSLFTYTVNFINKFPDTQSPSSGTYEENFTLTLTFSRLEQPSLFENGTYYTYEIYYDGTLSAGAQFQFGLTADITTISNNGTTNLITLTADVYFYETPINLGSFTYNILAGGTTHTNVTPTSVTPSGTRNINFELILTFDNSSFSYLFINNQLETYYIYYDSVLLAQSDYTYVVLMPTFTFNSFTVAQINFNSIAATAGYSISNIASAPTAANFTYTVLIGATTYTYTTSNPYFTPTVGGTTFNFTFSSAEFPELFVNDTQQTHTLNYSGYGLSVNSSPVIITYSNTVSLTFTSIVPSLDPSDSAYVYTTFEFTYINFDYGPPQNLGQFYYVLNGTLLNNNIITWGISTTSDPPGSTSGFGSGTARFSRQANIFIQAASITHLVRYVDGAEVGPFNSATRNTVFTISDSNNILLTSSVTLVTLNNYKSIVLPAVARSKGSLVHFKILNTTSPYTFRIVPYFTVSPPIPPLLTKLYSTTLTFDSLIEATAGPLTLTSSTTRNTLTLFSDGTNWWIINRYTDTLTISTLGSTPTDTLSEINQTNSFRYTYVNSSSSYSKILLYSTSSSYLKYIFITNSDSSSLLFTIYLPNGKAFETLPGRSGQYNYFTFTIPAGKIAGIVLTYSNNTYYIISASINPSISINGQISETPTIISSKLVLLQNQPYYQVPYLPNFSSSRAELLIIKSNTTPNIQGETGTNSVSFQITNAPIPSFSLAFNSAVWFIGIQENETRQYYLPVCYYSPPA
jgi:hypothetical protein